MLLYLYAVAEELDTGEDLTGIGGETVELFDVHGIRLAAGWIATPPGVSQEALQTQDRVVRALHARARALLPFRFGTAAPDLASAVTSIEAIHSSLGARLARVRLCDQMTVRVLRAAGAANAGSGGVDTAAARPGQADGPGARYLRARAAARELPQALQPTFDAVRSLVRATAFEPGRHADVVGTVYHLIGRGDAALYRAGLERAAARERALILRITGPSPAYAFTGG